MRLFDSGGRWQGQGTILVVALLTLLTLAFAVRSYAEWSSDQDAIQFANMMPPVSVPHPPGNGATGCPRGTRSLPTELMPLP
jgi:hypothetical protein